MEAGGTQALLMNIYRKIDRTVSLIFWSFIRKNSFTMMKLKNGWTCLQTAFREDLNLPKFQKDLAVFFAQRSRI